MTLAVVLTGRRGTFALDIEFEVPAPGVTALLGPSGSGKTSILRAIAGLDRHVGAVSCGDTVWQNASVFVPTYRRAIGYVAQGPSLLPHLTVARNLDYAARRAPAGRFDRDDIVRRTGIGALLGRFPRALSGGEARRASIARVLMGQPQLLLMDEPLSGLDSNARAAMTETLAELFAMLPLPVLYVTHDAREAARLATTTVRVDCGRIDCGSP